MLAKYLHDTPFNVDAQVLSKNEGQNAEAKLSKPYRPPVNIVLAVNQEVLAFSHMSCESAPVPDGFELFDILNENKNSKREEVEVESKDLKS
jgi:hypothetical protein